MKALVNLSAAAALCLCAFATSAAEEDTFEFPRSSGRDPFSFTQLSVIFQRCGRIQQAEDAMARAHMLQGRPH